MKKAGRTLVLLLAIVSLAGCAVGPCEGYGCPAFAHSGAQAPQPAGKSGGQNSNVSQTAQNQSAPARAVQVGQ